MQKPPIPPHDDDPSSAGHPGEASYALISPCRNEAEYMCKTLDSVINQDVKPDIWVIVDDGSTDETPNILDQYKSRFSWIHVVKRIDRGHRSVGPGVIDAFYEGVKYLNIEDFKYICKLDLDLDLPPGYFKSLVDLMEADPRLGTCSGKPYFRTASGRWVSEKCGDEASVGMTKFYRVTCFRDIGGFVREVNWDAIDCHKARQLGWIARSWDTKDIRFEHLRPMGSSQKGIMTGRVRAGYAQYFMGTDPLYLLASAAYRMTRPPLLVGGMAMIWGYFSAWLAGRSRHDDPQLRALIRRYQRRALIVGKTRALEEVEEEHSDVLNIDAAHDGTP